MVKIKKSKILNFVYYILPINILFDSVNIVLFEAGGLVSVFRGFLLLLCILYVIKVRVIISKRYFFLFALLSAMEWFTRTLIEIFTVILYLL